MCVVANCSVLWYFSSDSFTGMTLILFTVLFTLKKLSSCKTCQGNPNSCCSCNHNHKLSWLEFEIGPKNSTFLNYNLNFSFNNLEAHFDRVDIFVNWSTAMKRTIQTLSLKLKWKVRDWVSDGCHFGAVDLPKYLLILLRTRRSLYCQFIWVIQFDSINSAPYLFVLLSCGCVPVGERLQAVGSRRSRGTAAVCCWVWGGGHVACSYR